MAGRYDRLDPGLVKSWFEDALRSQGPIVWTGGGEGKCRCPLHDDKAPSFSVNAEKGTWHCHAGCGGGGLKELAKRLDISPPWGAGKRNSLTSGKSKETLYDYLDAEGRLIYQVVRKDTQEGKKRIFQRQPDGKGGWMNSMKGAVPLPYRLPALLEGISSSKWIFIAEGEKCVDALVERGFTATTNHGGAGKWQTCHSAYFPADCHVAILPDNDKAGRQHAQLVADALLQKGCEVKVLDLGYPYVEVHAKDIFDWFAEGHTREDLIALVRNTSMYCRVDLPDEIGDSPEGSITSYPDESERCEEPIIDFPDIGKRGAVLATIANLKAVLSFYKIRIYYDEIAKEIRFFFKESNRYSRDNHSNASLAMLMSLLEQEGMPTQHLDQFLYEIADSNRINPVRMWIESRYWDGVDRVLPLCDTIETPPDFPDDLKNQLIRKWLISAVAAACHDPWARPFSSRGVLTLHGSQGIGKTKWLRSLAPGEWIKDGLILDPSNKDLVQIAISHWICELGELDSTFKRDIGRLKAFLTMEIDQLRLPYARGVSKFPRRTVFAASVNKPDFLVDDTGNSRFWVIPVISIDYKHTIDTQQVFAQLYAEWKQGAEWWLTHDEDNRLASLNEEHEERDEIYDLVTSRIDWSRFAEDYRNGNVDWCTPTDVLIRKCRVEYPTKAQRNSCAKLLRKFTGLSRGKRQHTGSAAFPIPTRGA